MIIDTSRFGQLEVDEDRLITFEDGVLGFPKQREYALIQTGEGSGFYWLQSVCTRDLAFVVCDPRLFVGDYQVPVKLEELRTIGLTDAQDAHRTRVCPRLFGQHLAIEDLVGSSVTTRRNHNIVSGSGSLPG